MSYYPPPILTHGDGTLEERGVPKWRGSHHLQLLLQLCLLLGCECLELALSSGGEERGREGEKGERRREGGRQEAEDGEENRGEEKK